MNRFRLFSIAAIAVMTLSACATETFDADSNEGVFLIEHTGPGTVYWK